MRWKVQKSVQNLSEETPCSPRRYDINSLRRLVLSWVLMDGWSFRGLRSVAGFGSGVLSHLSLSRDPFSFRVNPLILYAPVPVHMNPEQKEYVYKFFRKSPGVFPPLKELKTELHGLSPRANYTDRATAACFSPFKDTCHV
jgi:hypothetical protein